MQNSTYIWLAVWVAAAVLFFFYRRLGAFFRCAVFTGFTGLGGLGLLHLLGNIPGMLAVLPLAVGITPLTVAVSVFLGLPGVVTLLIIYLI